MLTILEVNIVRIVSNPFLKSPFSIKGAAALKKRHCHKNCTFTENMNQRQISPCASDHILCYKLYIKT